jgi:hypothetical protein
MNANSDTLSAPSATNASRRAPAPIRPLNGALLDGSDLRLEWEAVPGATGYRVQIATDEAFGDLHFNDAVGASTTLTLFETFPPNHARHYWRAAAQVDGAWTAMGPAGSFVAGSEADYERRLADATVVAQPPRPEVPPAPPIPADAPPYLRESTSTALAAVVILTILVGLLMIALIPVLG